jgi:hypothetical protein
MKIFVNKKLTTIDKRKIGDIIVISTRGTRVLIE